MLQITYAEEHFNPFSEEKDAEVSEYYDDCSQLCVKKERRYKRQSYERHIRDMGQ